jgi:hypothetical protein
VHLSSTVLPPSLDVSISRIQNFAHNIRTKKNKGVGGWV